MKRALVVGAGIGGLAAAIALRRAGWDATVYERAAAPRELGFALLLAPNAMRALRSLGVADAVLAKGSRATFGETRRASGAVLKRIDFTKIAAAVGEETVCALRPALHGTLLEALPPEAIRLSAPGRGFLQDDRGVTLMLADGGAVQGEVLIGADGIGSVIRRELHGDAPVRRTGLLAWRGVAHGVNDVSAGQYLGRGLEAGCAQASADAIYWFVCAKGDRVLKEREPKATLRARLGAFDPRFLALIDRTDEIRCDEIVDREPLDEWGEGRVTLLGDAAHPMTPHAGQGAAQALEDAVALGEALAKTDDVSEALRRYERERVPRSTKLVELSRGNARVASVENRFLCAVRDTAIRLAPASVLLGRMIQTAKS